jgi:Cdc6-like AAA superfamily ATPase
MGNTKTDYHKMSLEERIKLVEQLYIQYPRINELLRLINHCREFSKISAEPECMLITGVQGAGKTTLIRRYAREFHRTVTLEKTSVPVLTISIPVPATIKGLATKLLAELGDPAADKGTVSSQTLRLYKYLQKCDVQLIILDEFQHFIDRESLKVLRTVSDWLKNMLNDTTIPIILIGMPKSETVLDEKENVQLKRRFPSRERLEPFGWKNIKEQEDFRRFLKLLDEGLPLTERSHLADNVTAYRIHCATGGVVNYVMRLVRGAAVLALQQGMEKIDLEILAHAFEERLAKEMPGAKNPFTANGEPTKHKPARRVPSDNATNKRVKKRDKPLTASEVLNQH